MTERMMICKNNSLTRSLVCPVLGCGFRHMWQQYLWDFAQFTNYTSSFVVNTRKTPHNIFQVVSHEKQNKNNKILIVEFVYQYILWSHKQSRKVVKGGTQFEQLAENAWIMMISFLFSTFFILYGNSICTEMKGSASTNEKICIDHNHIIYK